MLSQRIRGVMQREKMLTAAPETTVSEAAKLMVDSSIGAIVVVDHGSLVGIFTERDAVFRVIAQGRDAQTTRLSDVMTPAPVTVEPDRTFGHALQLMHEHGFRHVPVVEDGKLVGIVSSRDALDPEMEDFVCEERRREALR